MKFSIVNDERFNIYVNNKYLEISKDEDLLYDSLKKILLNIKKRYDYDVFGFYQVDIYIIEDVATLLEFYKKDESFISKTIDLKLVIHNQNDIYLKFIDFLLIKKYKKIKYKNNNFYVKVIDVEKSDIEKLLEHFEIVIDKDLNNLSYI